jgi:mono/diheme cytochrome c family protein
MAVDARVLGVDPAWARGEQVFLSHCHQCQPGGEEGPASATNNTPVPGFLITFQVRQGIGAMPAFSSADIPQDERNERVASLTAVRGHA